MPAKWRQKVPGSAKQVRWRVCKAILKAFCRPVAMGMFGPGPWGTYLPRRQPFCQGPCSARAELLRLSLWLWLPWWRWRWWACQTGSKSETSPARPVSSLHGLSFQVWKMGSQPTSLSTPKEQEKPHSMYSSAAHFLVTRWRIWISSIITTTPTPLNTHPPSRWGPSPPLVHEPHPGPFSPHAVLGYVGCQQCNLLSWSAPSPVRDSSSCLSFWTSLAALTKSPIGSIGKA